jgi:hypothetical protein
MALKVTITFVKRSLKVVKKKEVMKVKKMLILKPKAQVSTNTLTS